jgi:sarcosine oxidase subunit beta
MPFALLKYGLRKQYPAWRQIPARPDLKPHYDVVIIGGGGHGLAAAYYLSKTHGIANVAVLDKGYLGGGNTARNTAIIRSNYLTPEGVRFYDQSVKLFQGLSNELDFNILYSERGHFTLAHTDAAIRTSRWRAEVNRHLGVDSRLIFPDEIARIEPTLNLSRDVRYPILGALFHPPGAIARHDAVAWGYAIRAAYSSVVGKMAGLRLPIRSLPLQACVSQPLKPFLNTIVVSGSLHIYISQSSRGELVMGGATDPYSLYSTRSSLEFTEGLMAHMLELFPFLGEVKVMRQWAGITDMTPDFAPIMGKTRLSNYYIDAGWGTWGFKATPACGVNMAALAATGEVPEMISAFSLERFSQLRLLGERGAASVGH